VLSHSARSDHSSDLTWRLEDINMVKKISNRRPCEAKVPVLFDYFDQITKISTKTNTAVFAMH